MKQKGSKTSKFNFLAFGLTLGVSCAVVMLLPSASAFTRRYVTRFCYTSPNTAQILSQCVLCDYFAFPSTLLGCTGSTALTTNMTATQALCVINGCFGQVQQVPSFSGGGVPSVGKKKRDVSQEENVVGPNEQEKPLPNALTDEVHGLSASAMEDVQIVKTFTVHLDLYDDKYDDEEDMEDETDS